MFIKTLPLLYLQQRIYSTYAWRGWHLQRLTFAEGVLCQSCQWFLQFLSAEYREIWISVGHS